MFGATTPFNAQTLATMFGFQQQQQQQQQQQLSQHLQLPQLPSPKLSPDTKTGELVSASSEANFLICLVLFGAGATAESESSKVEVVFFDVEEEEFGLFREMDSLFGDREHGDEIIVGCDCCKSCCGGGGGGGEATILALALLFEI
uniref:Uncharacterized protein n=1 Tax=Panagrolaimus sp. ES5 TaxID=591445 RepID=A0AC34G2Y3_9BILA